MAIAGIEGLAQGFMQGMALKRQNDRQDVLDAQNLERFSMDKERFATQQAASAFDLQNAQTNAANAAMDRTRNLRIQADQDAFDVKMKRLLSTGDDNLATLAEVEKVHIEDGVKGAFQRDPKTGVILTDEKGVATWINADGSPPQKHTGDSARKLFFTKQYPKEAMTREITNADTIASENRKEKTTIAAEERAAKTAKEKDALNHSQAMELARLNNNARDGNIKLQLDYKDKQAKAAEIELFTPHVETARRIFGNKKITGEQLAATVKATTKEKFIKSGIDTFDLANKKLTPEQRKEAHTIITQFGDKLYGTGGATTSGTDTYDSPSQGKLVPIGLEGEAGAIELNDRQPVSVEEPSAVKSSTDKPATPKSLTVPRPSSSTTPAKTYKGNAGTMLPGDYLAALGVAIKNGMPVMPPPKQYPQGTTFFGNNANPLDQTIKLGTK